MKRGFTLIELLIVIAILGVLAVVVLLAINPIQQLARARDAGRSSAVTHMGHAIESFATVRNSIYPTDSGSGNCTGAGTTISTGSSWISNCLVNSGEIKVVPSAQAYTAGGTVCTGGRQEANYCYRGNGTAAVVYATAEANSNQQQCSSGTAYFVYSTAAGRGGLWCGGLPPSPGVTSGFVQ